MIIEELQRQMVTQSAQIKLLLGQVAEMIAQSRIPSQMRKGTKQERVQTATKATNNAYERKRKLESKNKG